MTKSKLDRFSTLELLIELMYGGRSGLVDELRDHEPIPSSDLLEVLRVRAGSDVGDDFDSWYQWYLSGNACSSAEEQDILGNLFAFKQKTDDIVERIKAQRSSQSD